MNTFLVDYENIKTEEIKKISIITEGDKLFVFYNKSSQGTTLDFIDYITDLKLVYNNISVNVGTKNALDFQLSSVLGFLIGTDNGDSNYYIVSNDKGYQAVVDFWAEKGFHVERLGVEKTTAKKTKKKTDAIKEDTSAETNNKTKSEPKKKNSKISGNDLASLKEVTALVGDEKDAVKIAEIFNSFKTKQAINNGITKYYKDSKKAGEIYKKLKPLFKAKKKQ